MENNDIKALLYDKTNKFKIFCLKMQNDYNFYYQSLAEIDSILKDINNQRFKINEILKQESLTEEERRELIAKKEKVSEDLKSWQAEAKDYISECNKIKKELQTLGITTENVVLFEESERYANLIKKITVYNVLKSKKETDERVLFQQEITINEEFKSLFKTTEDLITKEANSVFLDEVVNSLDFEKVIKPQKPFLAEPEEPKVIFPGTLKRDRERKDELKIAAAAFDVEKMQPLFFEPEELNTEPNSYHIFEPFEEEKPTPVPVEEAQESPEEKSPIEEPKVSDITTKTIEKRIENYDHYWDFLFKKMDSYNVKIANIKSVINERMAQNQSISNEAQELDTILKLQEVIAKEIRRVSAFTLEDKKNVYLNLNIPNLDMSGEEIEEYLMSGKPFDYFELPKKYQIKAAPPTNLMSIEEIRKDNKEKMLNQLELIKQLKKANVDNEKIAEILEIVAEDKSPRKEKTSMGGKIYRWCRKAKKATSDKVRKNIRPILAAAGVAIIAYGATQLNHFEKAFRQYEPVNVETQGNIKQPDIKIEVTSLEEPIVIEKEEAISASPILENVSNSNEIKVHLGENFIIANQAHIYSDEYLEMADIPTYSPDTIREVIGSGVRKADGTVELARTEERLVELVNAGGQQISVLAFDGFFDINDIQVQKGLSR